MPPLISHMNTWGSEFSGQLTIPNVGTSEGPGICNFQGFTHMAWKGLDGDNGIYWSQLASPSG